MRTRVSYILMLLRFKQAKKHNFNLFRKRFHAMRLLVKTLLR